MGRERSMHKEALGDFNQALPLGGRLVRGPDSGLLGKKWHLAK